MKAKQLDAHNAIDLLFRSVAPLSKDVEFITVHVEDCTLFIPVLNLKESMIPEFKAQFKTVYDLSQGS